MLHLQTVEPNTLGLLKQLFKEKSLESFVLVGGTALALQLGHRKSIDLDFFCSEPFDADQLILSLQEKYNVITRTISPNTVIAEINNIKVDFIRFRYAFKNQFIAEDEIKMLTLEDIAPMKIDAITGRCLKKDFYDLYYLLNKMSLQEMLELYKKMYDHNNIFHVLKSLSYFDDAENNPDPFLSDKILTWEQVKNKIINEVNAYLE